MSKTQFLSDAFAISARVFLSTCYRFPGLEVGLITVFCPYRARLLGPDPSEGRGTKSGVRLGKYTYLPLAQTSSPLENPSPHTHNIMRLSEAHLLVSSSSLVEELSLVSHGVS